MKNTNGETCKQISTMNKAIIESRNENRTEAKETKTEEKNQSDERSIQFKSAENCKNDSNDLPNTANCSKDFHNINNQSDNGNSQSGDTYSTIYIRSNAMGKLIGKRGRKIKTMQKKTKTKIKIDTKSKDGKRLVYISGTDQARQRAEVLIERLTMKKKLV